MAGRYNVVFVGFCGMTHVIEEGLGRDEAADCVKKENGKARRKGLNVTKVDDKMNTWEHEDGDAGMVGDDQGYLVVTRVKARGRCGRGRR